MPNCRTRRGPELCTDAQRELFAALASSDGRKALNNNAFRNCTKGLCLLRAITVLPGVPNSARLDDIAEPPLDDGAILVRTLALGVCGTDREIVAGDYGDAPPGSERLVLGHESFGEVIEAPPSSGFAAGDLVVGIVRRPDPAPCPACAAGEWDMCRNGQYTERGIKARHGFGAERFRIEPEFAVKIDPALGALGVLMEPASIVAKAWDHIERIGRRFNSWQPKTASRHRLRPDRPARRAARRAARLRGPRAGSRPRRRPRSR